MRIGIISDTHMPSRAKGIPQELVKGLKGVDLILHAGDWTKPEVVHAFESLAPIDGVAGNNDGEEIIRRFGRKKIITLAGYRIGMIHGDGVRKKTEERAWEAFADETVDVIVFGHSHVPFLRKHQGVLVFNPGSPTDKRRQPRYSYGVLTLANSIKAEHYYYDDKT
ncbi:metallophosphoesterase family protein [Ammoniphilus sp. CFH 90114]|uniref:metallophosphoesterase family protein n=1 Tax=Ammoniphilus sp. CFH 90114 TaxID=2493665 RepID=UPI00100FC6BE|nr:metallophosphoesterase [Ammoniphilus sp. CFH 90114]RXT08195.1 metallophosphoesterase [Ammoniphilus sp. CFH 90114]